MTFEIILIIAIVIISTLAIYGKMKSRKELSRLASACEKEIDRLQKERDEDEELILSLKRMQNRLKDELIYYKNIKPIDNKV